ncbi:MAG: hypothetical protein AVO35_07225 [Candidatus Aegiribacteria sp. MLS_C]|nr:MAG: hypothetical protein AVO35_07225 [Candidatus Aegiribacteria sp. MLS_C]
MIGRTSGGTAIAVSLKAPDPAAVTARSTLARISPVCCPSVILRYDHWDFTGEGATEESVTGVVRHYTDIVNPNKQKWCFESELDAGNSEGGLLWVPVLVTDMVDSVSENWSNILGRSHPGLGPVRYSVLWRLGYDGSFSEQEAESMAMEVSVATHRRKGLLANPVSQEIRFLRRIGT